MALSSTAQLALSMHKENITDEWRRVQYVADLRIPEHDIMPSLLLKSALDNLLRDPEDETLFKQFVSKLPKDLQLLVKPLNYK